MISKGSEHGKPHEEPRSGSVVSPLSHGTLVITNLVEAGVSSVLRQR